MERTQDTKLKQSFNSPTTCFLWLPAYMKTSSSSRLRIRPSFDQTMYHIFFFFGKRRLWDSRVHLRWHSQIGRSIRRKKEETAEECRNKVLASKHWHGSLSVHLCWFALTSLLSRFITLSQLELVYKWKAKTKILLFSPSMWPILNMGTVVWRGKYYIQPMKREEKDTFVSSFEVTTFYLFKLLSKYLH